MATEHLDLWESLIGSRKNALKQASMVGWDTFFQVATRSITLEKLVAKVCDRIGVRGRAIQWDYAEPCMDVDKPHQLELLRADLAKQLRKSVAKAKSAAKKTTKKTVKTETAAKAVKVKKGAGSAKKAATFEASGTNLKAEK